MTSTPSTLPENAHLDRIAAWDQPDGLGPRGTVIVVVGRGEHPALYERFGRRIAADAWKVRAVDDPIADPARTAAQITALLGDEELPSPKVLVGSDSGAAFVAAEVAQARAAVDGVILVGLPPSSGSTASGAMDWDAELVERTSCPTHRARLTADGEVRRGALADTAVPQHWIDAATPSAIAAPVLGLHGALDVISPLEHVRDFYAQAPNARLISIVGGKHDALNDATHRVAAATVVLFLESLKIGPSVPEIAHIEGIA